MKSLTREVMGSTGKFPAMDQGFSAINDTVLFRTSELYGLAVNSKAFTRTGSRPFLRSSIVVWTSMSGLMPTPSNSEPSGR